MFNIVGVIETIIVFPSHYDYCYYYVYEQNELHMQCSEVVGEGMGFTGPMMGTINYQSLVIFSSFPLYLNHVCRHYIIISLKYTNKTKTNTLLRNLILGIYVCYSICFFLTLKITDHLQYWSIYFGFF